MTYGRAEHSSAALCITWAGVPVLECSPWEDVDRISLHPWEFARSVFLTNHHKQLNWSLQLDSAPISVPADSNLLNWVLSAQQRPLWQCATERGREEKAAVCHDKPSSHGLQSGSKFISTAYLSQMEDVTDMHLLEEKKNYKDTQLPFSIHTLLQVYI